MKTICRGCGAPLHNTICEYCGRRHVIQEPISIGYKEQVITQTVNRPYIQEKDELEFFWKYIWTYKGTSFSPLICMIVGVFAFIYILGFLCR